MYKYPLEDALMPRQQVSSSIQQQQEVHEVAFVSQVPTEVLVKPEGSIGSSAVAAAAAGGSSVTAAGAEAVSSTGAGEGASAGGGVGGDDRVSFEVEVLAVIPGRLVIARYSRLSRIAYGSSMCVICWPCDSSNPKNHSSEAWFWQYLAQQPNPAGSTPPCFSITT
jgi:hypothetical protein